MRVAVVDYGSGNLASASRALELAAERDGLRAEVRVTADPDWVARADRIVLPGQGAFADCARGLAAVDGMRAAITQATDAGTPFLGICVGMQMLYDSSEETPGVAGLGILEGVVRRLPEGQKHPQMQWNVLQRVRPTALLAGVDDPVWVYFVHSFAPDDPTNAVATCDYGGAVVAAVERGRLWATQFHPEKSGATGLRILANFVDATRAEAPVG